MALFTFGLFLVFAFANCVPENQFFPFGANENDSVVFANDDQFVATSILVEFKFFNHTFNELWVNTNGALTFNGGLATFTPRPFPYGNSIKMIAVYWADVDTRINPGKIYYRETNDSSILNAGSTQIGTFFQEFANFSATWAFIATWYNVTFYGGSDQTPTNTYQCALFTDGYESFAIYNYATISWTTGTASRGNKLTGLGGVPAQVGFDAGDNRTYTAIPESRTGSIVNVASLSNLLPSIPGKYIFQINKETIEVAPPIPGLNLTLPLADGINVTGDANSTNSTLSPPGHHCLIYYEINFCESKLNGTFVHPNHDCTICFYICSNGVTNSHHCVNDLYFDPKSGLCSDIMEVNGCIDKK